MTAWKDSDRGGEGWQPKPLLPRGGHPTACYRWTHGEIPPRGPKRGSIKWPQACKTTAWEQFDEDVDKVLEASVKGNVDWRLQAMTTIIISLAQERFGAEEKRSAQAPYTMNQRAVKIHKILCTLVCPGDEHDREVS